MTFINVRQHLRMVAMLSVVITLAACGGDDNDDEVRSLQNRVSELETRIASVEENDGQMDDALADIAQRLSALELSDAGTRDDIATIRSLLDALEERLDALEAINASAYEIVLTNASANQPLAPAAVILHYDAYRAWTLGEPASVELETLAESGNPAPLLDTATEAQDATSSGSVLMPGERLSLTLDAVWRENLQLTLASMPVNTNDAFSGATGWQIAHLEPGESTHALLPVYDAGTEFNSENADTVPGPAAGGEGFNAERDDLADIVARHPGVVSADEGYFESALDSSHRFDQGLLHVRVTRLLATE